MLQKTPQAFLMGRKMIEALKTERKMSIIFRLFLCALDIRQKIRDYFSRRFLVSEFVSNTQQELFAACVVLNFQLEMMKK